MAFGASPPLHRTYIPFGKGRLTSTIVIVCIRSLKSSRPPQRSKTVPEVQQPPQASPETISKMRSWLKTKLSKELSLGAPASSIESTTRQLLETALDQSKFALTAEARESLIEEVAAT